MSIYRYMQTPFTYYRQKVAAKNANGQGIQEWLSQGGGKCFIQPAGSELQSSFAVQGLRVTHTVWVAAALEVVAGDKLTCESKTYLVRGEKNYRATGKIPSFVELQVEEIVAGGSVPSALAPVLSATPSSGTIPLDVVMSLAGIVSGDTWDLYQDGELVSSGIAYGSTYTVEYESAATNTFMARAWRNGLSVDSGEVDVTVSDFVPVLVMDPVSPTWSGSPVPSVASLTGVRSGDTWDLYRDGSQVVSGLAYNATWTEYFNGYMEPVFYARVYRTGISGYTDTEPVTVHVGP